MVSVLIIMVCSYLVGSFPTSIIVARMLKGIDIREYGSGNAPARTLSAFSVGKPAWWFHWSMSPKEPSRRF